MVEVLHHSIQQRDFSLIDSLTSEEGSCLTCADVQSSVEKAAGKGKLDLMTEPVRVKGARLIDKQNWVVGVLYRRPETVRVNDKGARLKTFSAENNRFIEMGLQWQGGEWTFYNFRFGEH